MGIYSRVIPKQVCIVCSKTAEFCVCDNCESSLSISNNRCLSCAAKLSSDLNYCGKCLSHSPYFSKAYTLYDYQDLCSQLIKQFKFDHKLCIGDFFAHKLYDLFVEIDQDFDAIIPLPLSSERLKERGYNQTHELLRVIAKKSNIVIDTSSVKRIKSTRTLSKLNLKERQKEIKDAFAVDFLPYKKVLLVDDVMTTGSSMNELAKTILNNTDVEVCEVMTLARA